MKIERQTKILELIRENDIETQSELLEKLNVFKNTPVILILDQGHSNKKNTLALPFSDVVHSPVNPYTVKQRVQNLTELFRIKETLENQVQQQMQIEILILHRLQVQYLYQIYLLEPYL